MKYKPDQTILKVVALRKESVDRNIVKSISYLGCFRSLSARRAWIEIKRCLIMYRLNWSLSARRAWIEIPLIVGFPGVLGVALRKESVDRNRDYGKQYKVKIVALRKESVDRNNNINNSVTTADKVALRKESVDRNIIVYAKERGRKLCRSPQGERG